MRGQQNSIAIRQLWHKNNCYFCKWWALRGMARNDCVFDITGTWCFKQSHFLGKQVPQNIRLHYSILYKVTTEKTILCIGILQVGGSWHGNQRLMSRIFTFHLQVWSARKLMNKISTGYDWKQKIVKVTISNKLSSVPYKNRTNTMQRYCWAIKRINGEMEYLKKRLPKQLQVIGMQGTLMKSFMFRYKPHNWTENILILLPGKLTNLTISSFLLARNISKYNSNT